MGNEADLLNVALFGITAKEWRENNSDKKGNIRDYATLEQLVVLSNMESINALLIGQGLLQTERLIQLNKTAITQMKSLLESKAIKKIKKGIAKSRAERLRLGICERLKNSNSIRKFTKLPLYRQAANVICNPRKTPLKIKYNIKLKLTTRFLKHKKHVIIISRNISL